MSISEADPAYGQHQASQDQRRWRALGLLCVAQFMLILDVTVVAIALPIIGSDLQLDRAALTWVMTAYTLCFGGLMLLGGRAADLLGARRVVLAGLAVFTAASLVSGLAVDAMTLIGGRIAQGVGAAMLSPAALSVITTRFHGDERNKALGVWGALAGSGAAVGVLLGGALTAGVGWQWIFFVNVPVGIVLLLALPTVLAGEPARGGPASLDVLGAATVTTATAAAIYGLINAGDHGWGATGTLWPIGAALAAYLLFALVEYRTRSPLVDLAVLARRPIVAGSFLMLVATGLLISCFFLGSFALQGLHGYDALTTGLLFLPVAVATGIGAHAAAHAVGHLGPRPVACGALVIAAAGIGAAALWSAAAALVIGVSVAAAGLGATFVAATTTAMARVGHHEAGVVSGIVNTFHELGGALGVAVISTIAATSVAGGSAAGGSGYADAFTFGAATAAVAAVLAVAVVPGGKLPAGAVRIGH